MEQQRKRGRAEKIQPGERPALPEVCPDQDRERKGAKDFPVPWGLRLCLLSSTKWAENFPEHPQKQRQNKLWVCASPGWGVRARGL